MKYGIASIIVLLVLNSCTKLVEVGPPITSINMDNVYSSEGTAIGAVTGIMGSLASESVSTPSGIRSLSVTGSLYTDELNPLSTSNVGLTAYFRNQLNSTFYGGEYWGTFYVYIYRCNAALIGVSQSSNLSSVVKKQLIGELLFFRSLMYYYLVNLYGDVPLVLSVDYTVNSRVSRVSKLEVLTHLVGDLSASRDSLSDAFLSGNLTVTSSSRYRPCKYAASALLTKVYLLLNQWGNAEQEATTVINKSQLFGLVPLGSVFQVNSKESIFQLQSVLSGRSTEEAYFFVPPSVGNNNYTNVTYLSNFLLNTFEPNDLRLSTWIKVSLAGGKKFSYPYKYKANMVEATPSEALTLIRLSDVILCRSEARAQMGKNDSAIADLNSVRFRAGLKPVVGILQQALIDTIFHERRVEFFTEFGNRLFDLKRSGKLNSVMNIVCPIKGGTWSNNWALFPIPSLEISRNGLLSQNPGY
ncbi:MAG: RagB/SusD family nutrient uptake outer membrane protein [Chitinophaga sp.]|uniref:RagB/SusD family nutrient uptake outer membrane protein n=1 Tax=Chitinophaga sp. TaxID=1869181 RepID=UPI0025BB0F6B|nr:RagB/SusD family nutrient uptake outer membrane protein [Chitinophaga sp.]MBV8253624.1 RagB/SusD family nutrient uptake outer membrane protein [Chitinophaga sp.]